MTNIDILKEKTYKFIVKAVNEDNGILKESLSWSE